MNLANKISISRILLIPFFIACILYYGEGREYLRFVALGIFLLATISDAVDGGIQTELGPQEAILSSCDHGAPAGPLQDVADDSD